MDNGIIRTKKGSVEYFHKGKGQNILFLHGALARLTFYQGLLEELAQNFEVHAFTYPGMGPFAKQNISFDFKDLEQITLEVIEKIGKKDLIIVGHSIGGGVAMSLAANRPELFKGLVLIDSAGWPTNFFVGQYLRGMIGVSLEFLFGNIKNIKSRKLFFDIIPRSFFRPRVSLSLARILAAIDLRFEMQQLNLPVRILWGAQDTYFPANTGSKIQSAINGSQLLLLPKKGHNWPVYWDREAAQAIAYQIENMS